MTLPPPIIARPNSSRFGLGPTEPSGSSIFSSSQSQRDRFVPIASVNAVQVTAVEFPFTGSRKMSGNLSDAVYMSMALQPKHIELSVYRRETGDAHWATM